MSSRYKLTLAAPLGLITVTELVSLVLACLFVSTRGFYLLVSRERTGGSSRRNNSTVQTGLGDNVHLNGGVTARVVHGTSVDLGDRHSDELIKRSVGCKSRGMKGPQEVRGLES